MMGNTKSVRGNKTKKTKFIIHTIFLLIFLLIITLTYFFNRTFKSKINSLLGKLAGTVGEYFTSSAGELENKDKEAYLANYYISLEPAMAADKLYIIKKNDGKLYSEIIKLMNSTSSSKTEEIIKLVRSIENNSGSLSSIYNAVQNEKEGLMSYEASRLESQDLLVTISEIKERIEKDETFKEALPSIIINMSDDRITDILYYIEDSIEDKILYSLEDNKRLEIENKLLAKRTEKTKLKDLASLYEMKSVEAAAEEIGNTEQYDMDELGIIYTNLSVLKSAEILSKLDDDSFIEELYAAIRKEEELNGVKESITNHISKSMQFITEYNKKIDDLVTVYGKMNANKAAKIVEKMMANSDTVTALEIDSEPVFEISDSSIIIDVLSRMRNKTLSSIMNYIDTDKASTLTQMLVEP